ncbi:sugar-binding transcriptional regulator [Bradyrhizobium arachidis]|uniref:Sugar-binding transcriptional regulator n=1 Tax=Bradyrhizobium arachidis TaxID=858423 RepID=A0AAE7NW89_9BRAD|nr:sugar-binding transcriptional regulator [Bradyrhizobium arachidis]
MDRATGSLDVLDQSNKPENENTADSALMARVCWHYFKEGQTQDAIAQHLQLTRKRVNRLLAEARDTGFVQITINSGVSAFGALESGLVERFGLRRAIVVPSPIDGGDARPIIGAAAGHYVSEHLPEPGTLGINWGGTINAAAQNLQRRCGGGNRVVLLCGGLAESTRINPYDNAAMMARALDAVCYYVTAPMFADTAVLRDAFVASGPVQTVLGMVPHLDMALLAAVDLSESSKALEYGLIDPKVWRSLLDAGAVGDICGHYLDAEGGLIVHDLAARVVNPPLKELLKVPQIVLAAGGRQKLAIIRAGIRAKLCHVLITDEQVARALLET